MRALAERLAELGRPILPSGISKMEHGQRRVDADELIALASAFGVSPNRLLAERRDGRRKVELDVGAGGTGTVVIGGADIAPVVTGLTFTAGPERGCRLSLAICASDYRIDSEGGVQISPTLHDALTAIGWAPPQYDDRPADEPAKTGETESEEAT